MRLSQGRDAGECRAHATEPTGHQAGCERLPNADFHHGLLVSRLTSLSNVLPRRALPAVRRGPGPRQRTSETQRWPVFQPGSERGPVALPVFKIGRSPPTRGGWVRLPGASAISILRSVDGHSTTTALGYTP